MLPDERAIYRELESAATFSYFDQKTGAETSPTSYHHVARASGMQAQEDSEKALARQRMKTAERHLREEILQLPEAQEYHPHHQRRVLELGQRPRSKSVAAGEGGAHSKKKRSPISERAGLRELEKLSKFSYFNEDASFSTGSRPHAQSATPVSSHSAPGVRNPGNRHSLSYAQQASGGPAHMPAAHDAPRDHSPSSRNIQYGYSGVPSYGTVLPASSAAGGRGGGNVYNSSQHGQAELRDLGGVESPRSIRDRWVPRAGSPKSIRSSAADGIYKAASVHRPTSAERERLLDEAFNDMLAGTGGGGGSGSQGTTAAVHQASTQDADWMMRLNPLAGMNLDNAAAGHWQQELDHAARGGGVESSTRRSPSPQMSALHDQRPRSANRPPSVPRNYPPPHQHQQHPLPRQYQHQSAAEPAPNHSGAMHDAMMHNQLRGSGSGSQISFTQPNNLRLHHNGGEATVSRSPMKAAASSGGGSSSYEELMRNLEQSRLKAQQARLSIMEKRAKFLPDQHAGAY
jgi:hypothetical protein